jgi:hypothetical protein
VRQCFQLNPVGRRGLFRACPARSFEFLEPGPQPVKLSVDHRRVTSGRGVAPERLARERERGGRSAQLVLRPRDELRVGHTASVSL